MMDNTTNGRTPEEIKKGLELCCVGRCSECPYREECDEHLARGGDMLPADVVLTDILALTQQLERERDAAVEALLLKPLSWDEAMGDDSFLEIKGDEYIDAALNCLAFGQVDGTSKVGFVIYKTHDEDELKLLESDYGKTWRCWARRPTDEEREAAAWEVE